MDRPALAFLVGFFILLVQTPSSAAPAPTTGSTAGDVATQPRFSIEPTQTLVATPKLLAEGKRLYRRRCAACHGERGEGDGQAAYLLYPRPRNLRKGPFRFVSTWEGLPTDEDLYRLISRGIPGSAMPSWAHLSEHDRWALVHYVKTLSAEPIVIPASVPLDLEEGELGEGVIQVPPEPANDASSIAKGRELFVQACVRCHGEEARGDGEAAVTLKDDEGIPIRPRDLTTGVFKGAPRPEQLYRTIIRGIPGTPMPDHSVYAGDGVWHLVHYVRSLSSDRMRERNEMKRYRIPAVRVSKLPDHPDSGDWRQAPKVQLHLMPLWWRYNRPEYLTVQAVHDGKELALLLVWSDASQDDRVIRPQDYRDAAAVQLAPPGDDPPFFAMGERGHPVNIWMWKAEREADIARFHDLESQYPNIGIDSYPNLQRSPYEQPMRHALTLESDPTFITAWGAGNIVADPTRKSSAEDLAAQGFGTLRARSDDQQNVTTHGVYDHGSYRVSFHRALRAGGKGAVTLKPGTVVPVAFAIWNGAAGDRDGKKSVTIWQELSILP